ncbi:MAG: class I mannose-6-phosphate isomerase [Opitutaceae bacterium]|jgi:mannose-6-phosphate isomerase class I|nr:class I mannose-6-phosphate isomerase [Opitutaceae bacterium]
MSFMFNPHPYDDPVAVNSISLPAGTEASITRGATAIAAALAARFASAKHPLVVALDGYVGAEFDDILNSVLRNLALKNIPAAVLNASLFKSPAQLDAQLAENLPADRVKDPVLLFGKLFHGDITALFAENAVENLRAQIAAASKQAAVVFVAGTGSAAAPLRDLYDTILYFDVTPKRAILRAKAGLVPNLGDARPRPFKETMRRFYYVDFEVAGKLRRELLNASDAAPDLLYLARSGPFDAAGECLLLDRPALSAICRALATQPVRCRPVYLEGVWGGSYISRIRKLPPVFTKLAWVFDLIPLEVSIVAQTPAGLQIELPYFTLVQKEGDNLMGAETVSNFGGYFPIRFNYDDTWHASGNMSIQVHPPRDYCQQQHGEPGQQDESYYVVATGHGAKTYLGFKQGTTKDDLLREARLSETSKKPFDHDKFVNAVPSRPGTQLILPGGTIHASGQNQVVLEIGSLTIGSYTYKLYDYLRADIDGVPRPIHTWHGANALDPSRVAPNVVAELVPEPKLLRGDGDPLRASQNVSGGTVSGEGWSEWLVGENPKTYFSLRRLEIAAGKSAPDDTRAGNRERFHVLALVDGETVTVEPAADPSRAFTMRYLDVIVVPASVGPYTIRNTGKQPAIGHKSRLK